MATSASNQLARSDASYYSPNTYSIVTTASGPWAAPQPITIIARLYAGGLVTLFVPAATAAVTVATPQIAIAATLPALFRPTVSQGIPIALINNGQEEGGVMLISSLGVMLIGLDAGANFAGNAGPRGGTVTFQQ